MQYSRFDRHEVFEMDDTSFVLDCIQKVKSFVRTEDGTADLTNMLFGLFDGFLYDEIYMYASEYLPVEMYSELEQRLKKVHLSLAA